MTIADRLKEVRAALGLTQREFAAQSGVSARGYQGYEDGRSVPGGEAIAGFVSVGINANWLLTGDGPMLLQDLHENEGAKNLLAQANASYSELTAAFHHKVEELYQAQLSEARIKAERDALAARLAQSPDDPLNKPAMRAIIAGTVEAKAPGAPADQIARMAVDYYCRAISEGMITQDGIGDGNLKKAG